MTDRLSADRLREIRDQNEHDRRGLRFAQGQRMCDTVDALLAEVERYRSPEVRALVKALRVQIEAQTGDHYGWPSAIDAMRQAADLLDGPEGRTR